MLGPLSTQLSFTSTLSVIPFSKTKNTGNKNNCFDSIPLNYWISTIKLVMQVVIYNLGQDLQSWQCK